MMDQFYVTCPSNSSMLLYPNNTLSRFTVKLNREMDLNGQWEVGLCEIQYPTSWHNIRAGYNTFVMREMKPTTIPGRRTKTFQEMYRISPGYYSVKELIFTMKDMCIGSKLEELGIDFTYDSSTRRVTFNTKKNEQGKITEASNFAETPPICSVSTTTRTSDLTRYS